MNQQQGYAEVDLQDTFTRFVNDMQWIEAHYEELRQRFPEEFVAVVEGKVIAHSPLISGLLDQLRPLYGENTGELAIKFIYKETPAVVL